MKKHQVKTSLFRILDKLPTSVGFKIYYTVQNIFVKDVSYYAKPNLVSFEKIVSILESYDISITDTNILEIGSGRFPIMPVLFQSRLSINRFFTYDINFHYSQKRICSTLNHFDADHYEMLLSNSISLPSFISYFPSTEILNSNLNSKQINFVFSRFVLEHLTPKYLYKLHKKLYEELATCASIIHLISPSDHRAYGNADLSIYDFLKYSKEEWNSKHTKFDYHNRLRLPEYIQIITNAGFEIEYMEHDKIDRTSKKYSLFQKLSIHNDFKHFSESDLLAGSIVLLLRKR